MTSRSAGPTVDLASLRGADRPRIRCVPPYVSSAGREAIECAALAGLHLDPWEQLVLVDALGERRDGKWAAFEVGLDAPRQNGKGSTLEARELSGAFAFGEKLIIHSAHEQLTSSEHFRRLLDLIEGVPQFDQRVLKVVRGKGSEAIELRGGQRIMFKTRTGGGGRGLTGDLVVLDEAMILPVATTAALVPTMAARSIVGNPQLWYAGSAVDQQKHEHGIVFTRLRNRALEGGASLAYFEFSAGVQEWLAARDLRFDPDRPEIEQVPAELLDDPDMWAQANPGLGIRISVEHIGRERGGALGAREFAVERLGIGDWPDVSEEIGRVISAPAWAALAEHDKTQRVSSRESFAIDTDLDQTWASIGVAGQRDDGRWQVHVVKHARGKGWIVSRCVELHEEHPDARFIVDPRGPAANLISDLVDAGIEPVEVTTQDYGTACADFVAAAVEDQLRYPAPQPELSDSVADARKGPMGDRWKWSRKNSTSADISPLVAVTLALWGTQNAETEFATVLYASDSAPATSDPEIGPAYHRVGAGEPVVLSQEDYTTCFACAQGGVCPVHGDGG